MKTTIDETVGDYRVRIYEDGGMTIDRHGHTWQVGPTVENQNVICALVHEVEKLRATLGNLLDTSAVIETGADYTDITVVNGHYEAAYDALPKRSRDDGE